MGGERERGQTGSAGVPMSARVWVAEGAELAEGDVVTCQLLHAGPGVLEAPHTVDATVGELEEVHLVDPHRPAAGRQPLPFAGVSAVAAEPGDDGGAFGDERHRLLAPVGECGGEGQE